uniref:Nad9 n=1 Tax=Paraurostyla sp. TaxID=6014 RepID=A0A3Q8BBX8_9STIC|nr:Nad9 [Paraurostyla sp.]
MKNLKKNEKNLNIYTKSENIYYLVLHIKLSSFFYSTQLIDFFSYELPKNKNLLNKNLIPKTNSNTLVYNFNSIITQQRFFFFFNNYLIKNIKKKNLNNGTTSISELFFNANWLERENAELNGIFFSGKKDLRNLLLQYGDSSCPMKKHYPSIGLKEIFYESVTDSIIQNPVSIQF